MRLKEFLKYIRSQGCKVIIFNGKRDLGTCTAYFDDEKNEIRVAALGMSEATLITFLAHEFSHYLQTKDKFSLIDNIIDYGLWDKWIAHEIELNEREIKALRNYVILTEWDAEMRAIKLSRELELFGFDEQKVLKGACVYIQCIKWSFEKRTPLLDIPKKHIKAKIYSEKELFASLTATEKAKMRKFAK